MIGISVAANKEWESVKEYFKDSIKELTQYIYGEYFEATINGKAALIYKCGARKSDASASTQYIIDKFNPEKILLIGTAAGINKKFSLLDILIPDTAVQGDCHFLEKGEPFQDDFMTHIDLSKYKGYAPATIASFDTPLIFKEDCDLMEQFNVDIRDMEAAAIANVCKRNNTEFVIIKGITDFPGNYEVDDDRQYQEYKENVPKVMEKILKDYLADFI